MGTQENKSSALLIIGNEILSGRTKDANTQYIGEAMAGHGVPLREVRVVPDIEGEIIEGLDALRGKHDYVFTTGGIGPTHDDITAATVAKAFDVEFGRNDKAYAILHSYYGEADLTEARATMADMPISDDMDLIDNPVSAAPGFRIGNVFVMAGVPKIMQAMLDHVLQMVEGGAPTLSRTIMVERPESEIAHILSTLQGQFSDVDIGSYPQFRQNAGWGVSVVLRHVDEALLDEVQAALVQAFEQAGVEPKIL